MAGLPRFGLPLTAREKRILALIGAGRKNREIADVMAIAVSTVETALKGIRAKTGYVGPRKGLADLLTKEAA